MKEEDRPMSPKAKARFIHATDQLIAQLREGPTTQVSESELTALCNLALVGLYAIAASKFPGPKGDMHRRYYAAQVQLIDAFFTMPNGVNGIDTICSLCTGLLTNEGPLSDHIVHPSDLEGRITP